MTFGEFLRQRRKAEKMALRELAAILDISPSYLHNVECGIKPPLCREKLFKIVQVLTLTEKQAITFFDLAARKSAEHPIPADVEQYLSKDRKLIKFLRLAKQNGVTGAELLKS